MNREEKVLDFYNDNNKGGKNVSDSQRGVSNTSDSEDNPGIGAHDNPGTHGNAGGTGKQVQYYSNGRFSHGSGSDSRYSASSGAGSTASGATTSGADPAGSASLGASGTAGSASLGASGSHSSTGSDSGSNSGGSNERGRDIGGFTGTRYSRQYDEPPKKRLPSWAKALIIIGCVIVFLVLLGVGCSKLISGIGSVPSNEVTTGFGHDYIGTLYIEDALDEYSSGVYNHQYTLNAIDAMIEDSRNKGMILYVNTPGGTVYASDELYLKIREYQSLTGRPVYASMQSQAASGGYYISASCDKIIANRNCWTGSIGVTMGSFVDVSELLDNLGIRTETITAGDNKAMGGVTEPMTDEQREIFQALVDESYEQFVAIVAEGRGMSVEEVKKLADGRLYTAKQALENGLIDDIGTYQDAVADMMAAYGLEDCYVEDFCPDVQSELSSLLGIISENGSRDKGALTDAEAIQELIDLNGTFRVSYMCDIIK